ncbi:hypothetical protein DET49_10221 [Salegentibacter sp. 24]|nr:hypothetical protein DET49_10221 [Salegentibacter sp. 24]
MLWGVFVLIKNALEGDFIQFKINNITILASF